MYNGKILTNQKVRKIFKISAANAGKKLLNLERSYKEIKIRRVQKTQSGRTYLYKEWFIPPNLRKKVK